MDIRKAIAEMNADIDKKVAPHFGKDPQRAHDDAMESAGFRPEYGHVAEDDVANRVRKAIAETNADLDKKVAHHFDKDPQQAYDDAMESAGFKKHY